LGAALLGMVAVCVELTTAVFSYLNACHSLISMTDTAAIAIQSIIF
jgi:hypothetical protein